MKKISLLIFLLLVLALVFTACNARDVESAVVNDAGELVLTYTDGSTENLGKITCGTREIQSAIVNDTGELIITYTDGTTQNLGKLKDADGNDLIDENPQGLQFLKQDDGTYAVAVGDAKYLNNITIPATYKGGAVVRIAKEGFKNCPNLEAITIPASVIAIDDYAFQLCSSLTTVNFDENSQLTTIGRSAFNACGLISITLPESTTTIVANAFCFCSSLTSVIFSGDSQLATINDNAFLGCSSLTSIVFGENCQLTAIGAETFSGCSSLTSIAIPDSVTTIGYSAFSGCSSLTTVYYGGTTTDWANINIVSSNYTLTSATRYYYSATQPTTTGNYWHYDSNGNPVIWGN